MFFFVSLDNVWESFTLLLADLFEGTHTSSSAGSQSISPTVHTDFDTHPLVSNRAFCGVPPAGKMGKRATPPSGGKSKAAKAVTLGPWCDLMVEAMGSEAEIHVLVPHQITIGPTCSYSYIGPSPKHIDDWH